jgi:hypothetical protein
MPQEGTGIAYWEPTLPVVGGVIAQSINIDKKRPISTKSVYVLDYTHINVTQIGGISN